jgi:hypothetical protein
MPECSSKYFSFLIDLFSFFITPVKESKYKV